MPVDPTSFFLGTAVVAAGWLIAHRLTRHRDRENRQAQREKEREDRFRDFRRWLREWKIQIERCENSDQLFACWRDNSFFEGEISTIAEEIRDRNRFDELCETIRLRGGRAGEECNQTTYEVIIRPDLLKA